MIMNCYTNNCVITVVIAIYSPHLETLQFLLLFSFNHSCAGSDEAETVCHKL